MALPFRKRFTRADSKRALDFYAAATDKPSPIDIQLRQKRIRRPVDGRPVHASEHQEQAAVISWWALEHPKYGLPQFALFAIPNGGARDPITGSRLKAEGVRPGIVDLCLAVPRGKYHGWYGEMKVGDNKPTDKQTAVLEYLDSAGYKTGVFWHAADATKAIQQYLEETPL